jgi:anti-sigma factor RsiW
MRCEHIQPNLLDYGRGRLSGPEFEEVREHLRHCAECVALLKEELEFAARLSAAPEVQPTSDVWALVRARTRPRAFSLIAWISGLLPTATRRIVAASMAVAVIGIGLYAVNPMLSERPQKHDQPQTSLTLRWSDDPLGGHSDAMVEFIDKM